MDGGVGGKWFGAAGVVVRPLGARRGVTMASACSLEGQSQAAPGGRFRCILLAGQRLGVNMFVESRTMLVVRMYVSGGSMLCDTGKLQRESDRTKLI